MKNKKAISLIVLVITIIVMSILATTVIISVNSTNIIGEANKAVSDSELKQIEDIKAKMESDGVLGRDPKPVTINGVIIRWDEDTQMVVVRNEERDAATEEIQKKYGIVVPNGFSYVEGEKKTGIVIEDLQGNQFVWVPVEYTIKSNEKIDESTGLYPSFVNVFRAGMYSSTTGKMTDYDSYTNSNHYVEVYETNSYTTEKAEYLEMMRSVQKYKGFYIARFEAGDGDATSKRTKATEAHTVVSKKGAFVYNWVPWGRTMTDVGDTGAVYLARSMYKDNEQVVSTLCYGAQWDATLNWIASSGFQYNITRESRYWGNYLDSTGPAKQYSGKSNINYTTGRSEAWKANNIYDLAGNFLEWTMDSYVSGSDVRRSARGGYFDSYGGTTNSYNSSVNRLSRTVTRCDSLFSFRVTLYLK